MIRKLRLTSALVLYAFVTCHLLTIAFALGGLSQLDQAAAWLTEPWLHSPLKLLIVISMCIHMLLGLYALYRRNTLRMSPSDTLQYLSGFLLPIVLLPHVIWISIASELNSNAPSYSDVLSFFWIVSPWSGLLQVVALLSAWIHGSIGLLTVLHTKLWWPKIVWLINPAVVAVPLAAMLGFVEGGREVVSTLSDSMNQPDPTVREMVDTIIFRAQSIVTGILVIVLVARFVRLHRVGKQSVILKYKDGPSIQSVAGKSILEISHLFHVPHANLCHGRGRCGTCRCRVGITEGSLSAADTLETETLRKVSAGSGERLACQCIPTAGQYTVERIVPPDIGYGLVDDQPLPPSTPQVATENNA